MTLAELAKVLEEREGTITLARAHQEWCVWLYAGDDPAAAFFVEVDEDLEKAVASVIKKWGEAEIEERKIDLETGKRSGPIEIEDDG